MPSLLAAVGAAFAGPVSAADETAAGGPPAFNRDVRPILSENCLNCHGPDEKHRKGKLRLDTREGLFAVRDGRPVVAPGDPAGSELIYRITAGDAEEIMPPPKSKKTLTAEEIGTLRAWVEAGAQWQDHWAFITPAAAPLPELPAVGAAGRRPVNPIDHFLIALLAGAGLSFSPEADRPTLIRRVTYDLTGLPPTPDEVEAYVTDPAPDILAYEKVVDRLFASERYGERMALAWMDAARYGDSSTHHADGPRQMWGWRDWVIDAYNRNLPFDRFTVEQLAGDLLPGATADNKIASGFNRNHGTSDEGGAIDEEYRVEYVVDRVKTTANVWLGLTMECGQCHDHKYDPISQREYYQFYAYFNRTKDKGMQTRNGNAPPLVQVFTPEVDAKVASIRARIDALIQKKKDTAPPPEEVATWLAGQRGADTQPPALGGWFKLGPFTAGNKDASFNKDFGPEAEPPDTVKTYDGKEWAAQEGWEDGKTHALPIPDNSALYLMRTVTAAADRDIGVSLGSDDAIKVWVNGELAHANNAGRGVAPDQDKATLKLRAGENTLLMKIVNGGGPAGFYFKLGGTTLPGEIIELLAKPEADLGEDGQKRLADYYRDKVWPVGLEIATEIAQADKEEQDTIKAVPTSMVMEDQEKPRMTYLLERGHYDSPLKDQPVEPGVPAALPPLPEDAPPNRLGLARWLTAPDHPLTPRVAVNRYWAMLFGTGLVDTVSDFGTRGAWPSHPDLLDWVARDFVDNGWDIKRTLKQMVMSAAYRQSSRQTPELRAADPRNRLLARFPRLRLQGEFIRDGALAVSGLLNPAVGGPSTKPYQPDRIWNEVSLNGGLRYQRDKGDKLYRRGMYIYWKRSAPSPSMRAFDAPTREKCVIQRQRTNTPLQALVTLNDVQFVEAARQFAARVLNEPGPDATFRQRLDHAFVLATARPADELRHRVLGDLYRRQLEVFQNDPDQAKALLGFGEHPHDTSLDPAEHAAWTTVTSAILNLDETLVRE